VAYALLVRDRSDAETAIDRVMTVAIWGTGAAVTAVLAWMMAYLVIKGLPQLRPGFFTTDLSKVGPLNPGGGAKHAIIGTFEQVGIATVIVVPIAILTAIYLNEIQGRLAVPVRLVVDAMSGLPSIVAGLLVFTVWIEGHGYSGIAGSAALVVLMLPTVTRTSEEILRTIPDPLREGALALGAPQWRLILQVVIPTALAGLMTAVILGIARAIGETAPMLLTAFGNDSTNLNPLKGPQDDLPLFVWKLILLPDARQQQRAWTGALVLVLFVLVLFLIARLIASRSQRKLKGRR
jgi:phosphate transport system permease protein